MRKIKKNTHKLMSMFLAVLMVFGCFSAWPTQVSAAESDYEIYPKPHLMEYQSGDYVIHQNINIVYEDGIDEYTKARMNEVLAIKKINATISNEIKEDQTNILVGIKGSDGYVDKHVSKNYTLKTSGLYDKLDSYLLASDNGTITVLGKDTDAAFYGITSLYHIFNQMDSYSIRNFVMEDYADVASRGFIEGYYGNPWSTEDRSELMKWGGYYKLNSYFYAPKDDPKHNSKWRELYSDEEIETKIKPLAQAGNESKCRFVFALHPYMNNAIRYNSEENYQADLKVMQAKFAQVIEAGVRQIAILADDAGNVGGDNYIKTLKDMTAWIKEMQKTYPDLKLTLPFCTQEYMGNGQGYYTNFPENVQIVMTGGRVWGEVSNNFTTTFTNNVGRGPYMWINWPCTDNSKKHLIMGGYSTFLHPGVDPNKIQGIVLNPMQQSEPSKVAIFGNACYSWNIWETSEEADEIWEDSFKYVDHNSAEVTAASDALKELSKHMINQNMDSRVTPLQESVELKDRLNQFKTALNSGNTISDDLFTDLINEFTKLQTAAKTYRNEAGDTRIKDQIIYWLDCWDDTTEAAIALINGVKAVQDGAENDQIWDLYAQGQAAFERSKTHNFHYVDHDEYAEVGVQHIVPFIKTMEQYLSDVASSIIDPSKQVTKFITNRDDTPTGAISNVFDNKANTEIVYKNPNSINEGTYVGVSYTKAIDVDKVIFRLGTNSNSKDTFAKSKVQFTNDGKEWKDLDGTIYNLPNEVVLEDLELQNVKGIRMIATEAKSNTWLGIRDIVVNPTDEPIVDNDMGTLSIDKLSLQGGTLAKVTDGDNSTFAHFAEDPYKGGTIKDYIPIDASLILTFKNPKKLGTINFVQDSKTDKITKYALEYTIDGKNWQEIAKYDGQAAVNEDVSALNLTVKAVRIRNLELNLQNDSAGFWWKVYDFSVSNPAAIEKTFMYTDTWEVYKGTESNLTDGDNTTALDFNTKPGDTSRVGDFIGWDFGKTIQIGKVHAVIGGDRNAGDKWLKYSLQYSADGQDWTTYKSYEGVTNGKDVIDENLRGVEARYVRLVNNEQKNSWVIFSEFDVAQFDPIKDYDDTNVYTNTEYRLITESKEDLTKLMYDEVITLTQGQYIGVDLLRIKDISEIVVDMNKDNLTIETSKNALEWTTVKTKTSELPDARYVRIINNTDSAITFNLNRFEVHSNELYAPSLYETTMGINSSWGVAEDSRNNGAAFDGNIDTTTEFADLPQKGQYIIYDLGQERNISKIQMFCQDSAVNYIRDADILISNDLENWTKVITIGDGVENKNDASVTCINSDAGYKASSTYPNKVLVEGTADNVKARYLKILMTATNNNRAVLFNEIVINDGEYVPVSNDPTFESNAVEVQGFVPQNMFDGDLTTAYKPNTTDAGYITYTLSDNLDVKKINIVQKGTVSNAKVMALVMVGEEKQWVQVGTLSKSLNEIYLPFDMTYELKIVWEANNIPTISEIVRLNDDEFLPELEALQKYVNSLNVDENNYTASSYAKYVSKLNQANEVLSTASGDKKLIIKAYSELQIAYTNLVTRGNAQLIKDELNKIGALVADDYTDSTWEALQDKVNEANTLLAKGEEELNVKEVADMVNILQVAKSNLITKVSVSKEVLQNYIDTNELDNLDTSKYLTSTATPFVDALKVAHDLIASDDATVKQLEDALTALQETRAALVLKATADEINAINGLIDSYKENNYTASTWKEFVKVLTEVKDALNDENSSEDITELTKTLKAAAEKLVERGDLTDLNILLETAEALDANRYTEESYNKLLDIIKTIKVELKDSSEMLQTDVDKLQAKLQAAIDALEIKPSVTPNEDGIINGNTASDTTTSSKTGDDVVIGSFLVLGMLSIAGLWLYRKKENC